MQKKAVMAIAAALALCAPAAAQRPGPGLSGPPAGVEAATMLAPPPPVYALMGHRETLGLSARQVAALDSIGSWLSAADRPFLRRLNGAAPRPRGDTAVANAERALAGNRARAARGVEGLLTDGQRTRTCELFRPPPPRAAERRRPGTGPAPFGGPGGRGGPGGISRAPAPAAGGGMTDLAFFHWPWCPQPEPAATPAVQRRRGGGGPAVQGPGSAPRRNRSAAASSRAGSSR